VVKKDNDRLRSQLLELKVRRKEREKQEREITEPPKRELKKDHRLIPGGDTYIYLCQTALFGLFD